MLCLHPSPQHSREFQGLQRWPSRQPGSEHRAEVSDRLLISNQWPAFLRALWKKAVPPCKPHREDFRPRKFERVRAQTSTGSHPAWESLLQSRNRISRKEPREPRWGQTQRRGQALPIWRCQPVLGTGCFNQDPTAQCVQSLAWAPNYWIVAMGQQTCLIWAVTQKK